MTEGTNNGKEWFGGISAIADDFSAGSGCKKPLLVSLKKGKKTSPVKINILCPFAKLYFEIPVSELEPVWNLELSSLINISQMRWVTNYNVP